MDVTTDNTSAMMIEDFAGSETCIEMLRSATERGLTVLLPGADKAAAAARQTVDSLLAGLDLSVRYHRLAGGQRGLQAAARRIPGAIVVWTVGAPESDDEARIRRELDSVLGHARCSVLLVR